MTSDDNAKLERIFRADDKVTPVSAGDLCFAAAGTVHGFEKFTPDFAVWTIVYGGVKRR